MQIHFLNNRIDFKYLKWKRTNRHASAASSIPQRGSKQSVCSKTALTIVSSATKCFIVNIQHLTSHQASISELSTVLHKHAHRREVQSSIRTMRSPFENDKLDPIKNLAGTLMEMNSNLDRHRTFIKNTEERLTELLDGLRIDFKHSVDTIKANFSDSLQSAILKYEVRYSELIQRLKGLSSDNSFEDEKSLTIEEVNWKNQSSVENYFSQLARRPVRDSKRGHENDVQAESAHLVTEIEHALINHEKYFKRNNLLENYAVVQEDLKELGMIIKKRLMEVKDLILQTPPSSKILRRKCHDQGEQEEDPMEKRTRKKLKTDSDFVIPQTAPWEENSGFLDDSYPDEEIIPKRRTPETKKTKKRSSKGSSGKKKTRMPFKMVTKESSEILKPQHDRSRDIGKSVSNSLEDASTTERKDYQGSKPKQGESHSLLKMGLIPFIKNSLSELYKREK